MYALVDGNNFYVSCETAFRSSLRGLPVVVLSNNDGCAIARSNEAKALGIKMGAPWFEIRHFERTHGLVAMSANFVLYGDLSDRMMSLAAGLGPTQERYSIDESFIGLHGVRGDLVRRSRVIRERILRWVGIPCGIGIGQTKTLAKLANHIAKSAERKPGSYPAELAQVCNLCTLLPQDLDDVLAATQVDEVWGVGRRIAAQLHDGGVHTVLDLVRMDPATVRRRWSVVLERTVRELQGMECIRLDDAPAPKNEIACTRSFGRSVTDLQPMLEAVSEFATRAAEKARKQGSLAGQLLVFAHTSPFRPGPRFSRSAVMPLRRPTADTALLIQAATAGMTQIYESGYQFAKAGVMLLDLAPSAIQQGELDLEEEGGQDRTKLMAALDSLNGRYGKGTVHVASTGATNRASTWGMKQERRTPHYTTCWNDIPIARA
ncbi:Y-family DNA polymerase [Acidovorax sp.]|uniref:Y-family DNA polymerase n=1 Tax=Acidovorax sp. TaxID=1872122 RepID=UPI0025C0977C|nr:Y-family DNA polymerase [Acidovorax sp.]